MPTLDNILGNLVNEIPEQKLPDKETCSLISDIFSNLAEAHRYYADTAKGLADIASLVSTRRADISSGRCCTTNLSTHSATWTDLAACCPTTAPQNIDYAVRPKRVDPVL